MDIAKIKKQMIAGILLDKYHGGLFNISKCEYDKLNETAVEILNALGKIEAINIKEDISQN